MNLLLTITTLFFSIACISQDSVRVKITKIKTVDSITTVWMKSKNAKYETSCKCFIPYKVKDIVWIRKP